MYNNRFTWRIMKTDIMLLVVELFRFCYIQIPETCFTLDCCLGQFLMLIRLMLREYLAITVADFFFISRKLYFWSVDETCVSEICKYTNLIETNDFFTSAISTLPVIFIILTKTFCLLQYSFLLKTQAISSTTFLTSFFTKIGTIYCSKGRLNLMRTFFVSFACCLKLRNV